MKLAICDNEKIEFITYKKIGTGIHAKKMIISLKYIHTKIIKS